MPKAYSEDLRVRVIEMVRAGASRREAAEVFSVAGTTAVRWRSGESVSRPQRHLALKDLLPRPFTHRVIGQRLPCSKFNRDRNVPHNECCTH